MDSQSNLQKLVAWPELDHCNSQENEGLLYQVLTRLEQYFLGIITAWEATNSIGCILWNNDCRGKYKELQAHHNFIARRARGDKAQPLNGFVSR